MWKSRLLIKFRGPKNSVEKNYLKNFQNFRLKSNFSLIVMTSHWYSTEKMPFKQEETINLWHRKNIFFFPKIQLCGKYENYDMLVILFTAIIKTQNENCTQSIFRVVIQFRETQKFNLLSNFQFFPIYFLCVKKCWTTEEIKMEKKKEKREI